MDTTVVYSVHDCKVYPLESLTDAGVPTYGAAVDVPGINQVEFTPSITNNNVRGDGVILDERSTLDALECALQYAKLSPAALAVVDGGTVTQNAGTTSTRYVRNGDDQVPEFAIAALVSEVGAPGGAAKFYAYRCRMTGGTLWGASDQSYGQPTIDARAIPLAPAAAHYAFDLDDVATALPADGTALIATYADLV